ncbi:MAG TPA: DUF1835 domain-containing protein [Solirubrobacteraceae bacterium]|nr:DUF1835 domain-containing protein [Solirubrobacteraceae bacterium]
MTKQADFKRRVRERMAKTGESYTAARGQLLAQAGTATLHVTNGDSTALSLRQTSPVERVVAWRDVLHEGPVPDLGEAELRGVRASFLGTRVGELEERDAALATGRDGEYVLWFEADLYDQLQIAQILARLAALRVPAERITLICIGEYLGIARFGGLGELRPDQLEELPAAAAVTLTDEALDLATRAWAALRGPDPRGLGTIVAARSPQLRFMPEAFDRLGREYPWTRDGLSLTERRLLAAVAEGAGTAGEAFVRGAAREARPFLGDTWAFAAIERLGRAEVPLLSVEAGVVDRHTPVALTEVGRRVLDGAADHVALNGVDRWVGGVHLEGREVPWRWDEGVEGVVASAGA